MSTNPFADEAEKNKKKINEDFHKFFDNATKNLRIVHKKGQAPFLGYIVHWVPQINTNIGAPIWHAIKDRCPICGFVSEIWAKINQIKIDRDLKDEEAKKDPEVKKLFMIQQAYKGKKLYDMLAIDQDTGILKTWPANKSCWTTIFDLAKDVDWGDPSNPVTGYAHKISTTGEGVQRKYVVSPKKKGVALTEKEIEMIEAHADLARPFSTTEEIQQIINNSKEIIEMPKALKEPLKNDDEEDPIEKAQDKIAKDHPEFGPDEEGNFKETKQEEIVKKLIRRKAKE